MIEELKAEGHPLAVLVSVNLGVSDSDFEASLEELERLLQTAGGECFAKLIQNKDSITGATYIGSGKLKELNDLCKNNDIHMAIFDCELSPMQIRNIENALEDVRVIDRSMLILDIFALHAKSSAGKLQVELAQLKCRALPGGARNCHDWQAESVRAVRVKVSLNWTAVI